MSIVSLYILCLSLHYIPVHTCMLSIHSVCPYIIFIQSLHTFRLSTINIHTFCACLCMLCLSRHFVLGTFSPYILFVHTLYPHILCMSIHSLHRFYACPCTISKHSMHTFSPYILRLSMHCLHTVCDCPYILSIHSILILCPDSDTSNCHGWPGTKKTNICAYLNTLSIHAVLILTLSPYSLCLS